MKIIGKHDSGFDKKLDCKIIIENGIIGVYTFGDTKKDELNQPLNYKKWTFRKTNWKENKLLKPTQNIIDDPNPKPIYSHVLEYKTKHNETQRIFINPTMEERIEINFQVKPWWSGKNKKFNEKLLLITLSAIMVSILTLIIGYILKKI